MKYNVNNKPLVCMQTTSRCYKNTRTMTVKGVLWHSTGANNPNLKRYVQPSDNAADREYWLQLLGKNQYNNDWNHTNRQAGMNCWIGKLADGTVTTVQTMPWNYRPWGCGNGKKGSCNSGWIQFEICEDNLTDKNYFDKVYQEACEITAYLCKMYNLDPHGTTTLNGVKVPVILCHKDSYNLGLGNNHGDVYNWFNRYGKDMNNVRNDVAALMKSSVTPSTPEVSVTPNTSTFKSYRVKVTANALNIRAGASSKHSIVGQLKNGSIVTVVGESDKWMKISNGWIYSDYVEKIEGIVEGDIVKIAPEAIYYTGEEMPDWVKNRIWIVKSVNGDRVVIDKSPSDRHSICSPVNSKYLTVVESTSAFKPYNVKVTADVLNVRSGAGINYIKNGTVKKDSVHIIVAESTGKGATKWLKLDNNLGWISSDYVKMV